MAAMQDRNKAYKLKGDVQINEMPILAANGRGRLAAELRARPLFSPPSKPVTASPSISNCAGLRPSTRRRSRATPKKTWNLAPRSSATGFIALKVLQRRV